MKQKFEIFVGETGKARLALPDSQYAEGNRKSMGNSLCHRGTVELDITPPANPIEKEYDKSIHSNPDALAWAKHFSKYHNAPHIDIMFGWFANAMMAMHDHIYQTKIVTDKPEPKFKKGDRVRRTKEYEKTLMFDNVMDFRELPEMDFCLTCYSAFDCLNRCICPGNH